MKYAARYLIFLYLIVTFVACSDEPPSFRVKNERAEKANIQIKTVANTININDVEGGTFTGFRNCPEGKVEITAVIQSQSFAPSGSFTAMENYNYTIVLLNSTPPSIRIDSSEK